MIRTILLASLVCLFATLVPIPSVANDREIRELTRFSARKQFYTRLSDVEGNTSFSMDAGGVSIYIDHLFKGRNERRFLGQAVADFITHSRSNDVVDCAFEIDADNQPDSKDQFIGELDQRLRRGSALSILFFSKALFEKNTEEDVLGLARIGDEVSAMGINAVSLKKYFIEERLYRRQRGEMAGLIGHEFMHIIGIQHAGCVFEYRKSCDFIYRYGDCIARKVSGLLGTKAD